MNCLAVNFQLCEKVLANHDAVCVYVVSELNKKTKQDELFLAYWGLKHKDCLRALVHGPANASNTQKSTQGFALHRNNYPLKLKPDSDKLHSNARRAGMEVLCASCVSKEGEKILLERSFVYGCFGDTLIVKRR